jgi:hypothetical protein
MNASLVDRLVLRALAGAPGGVTLAALHAAVALDPQSDALQTFVAEISAGLVRLLMSGQVSVVQTGEGLRYVLSEAAPARDAVA